MATTIEDFKLRFTTEGSDKVKKVSQDINNLRDDINELGQVGGPLGNTINGIVGRFGMLGTGAVLAGGFIAALGVRAAGVADQLQDMADATGIGAGQLLKLRSSLAMAGGDGQSFVMVANRLSLAVGESMDGNEKFQKSFRDLGVIIRDSNGVMRDTGSILEDTLASLAAIPDPAIRSAKAYELLGKEAAKINWANVKAPRDAFGDQQVAELAKYRGAIDDLYVSIEEKLVRAFGSLAMAVQKIDWTKETKSVLDYLKAISPLARMTGIALESGPLREQAQREAAAELLRESRRGQKPVAQGDQGPKNKADQEKAAKDAADLELRIFRSTENARRDALLQFARDQEDVANIRAEREMREARKTITDKEELAAKIKEIETNRDLDIYNFRKSLTEREAADELRRAEQVKRELEALNNIIDRSKAIVEEQQRLNDLQKERNKFLNQNATATDRERKNAEELFNLERERLTQLLRISQIKDLPPDERLRREKEINAIFEERREKTVGQQVADKALQDNFAAGFERAYKQYAEDSQNAFKQAETLFKGVTSSFENSLTESFSKGKLLYKEFLLDVVQQLIRSNIQQLIGNIFGGSSGSNRLNSTSNIFKSLLGFANGGVIPTNGPVIVGERGPEILSGVSGRVVTPNNQIGGGNVTYNINAVDAMSFKAMIAADPTFLYAVTEQGRRRLPGGM